MCVCVGGGGGGGGGRGGGGDCLGANIIYHIHNISQDTWTSLPNCQTILYGASLDNYWRRAHGEPTNTVYTFKD